MSEPTPAAEPEFAAFIAIDWADRKHAWSLEIPEGKPRETGTFAQTPEAIEAWARQWATRFPGQTVAVALEQKRGALVHALSKYSHLVLFPIHPSTSHDYRKAMCPSGSKDDPRDADLLLDLLTRHRERLRRLDPDSEQTRMLQALVQDRRDLVGQRTAFTNQIRDRLQLYFPQVLNWLDELHTPMAIAFLQRWPSLPQLQQEDPEQVRAFFYQHGSRSQHRIQQRLVEMATGRALITDRAVVEPAMLRVSTLLGLVAVLNRDIRVLDQIIEREASSHPDYAIFSSFPAAGSVMGPRLLAAFGSQRQRYATANEMQSFSGIAPVISASGRKQWIHFRWACPKFLRQTFHEYAAVSIPRCAWARAYYQKMKANRKQHHAAVRALAYKWIRILFRCWKSGTTYQEDLYRKPPLPSPLPPSPPAPTTCGKRSDRGLKSAKEILKSLMQET